VVIVENMEEKLGAILNNPQMMQQIMSLAQSLGNTAPAEQNQQQESSQEKKQPQSPDLDLSILQKISGLAGQSGIDKEQKMLLQALSPYLSRDRVTKLENAMRAAKMAKLASSFLGSGGLQMLSGR